METRNRTLGMLLGLALVAATAQADTSPPRRLILQLESAGVIGGEYYGPTEILVVAPFEPALIELEVDGRKVATLATSPYRVQADLGERAIEHSIRVTASRPGARRVSWTSTINRGRYPLSIELVKRDGGRIEAVVTAPADDPVVEVEFFHDVHELGRRQAPPWMVDGPPMHTHLIHATARTRSGAEASHGLTASASVHVAQYEMRIVPLEVSVVNERGEVLTNLDRSAFRILDGGEKTEIKTFRRVFNDPISFSLLLDASNSMTGFMAKVLEAAKGFVESAMRPDDRASVYAIHHVPRRWQPLTPDREAVIAALGQITSRGNTAIWDALDTALRELEAEKNRRAIILLSDGEDTDSLRSWNDIVRTVRLAAVPIYVIAFGPEGQGGRHGDRLRYLAAESGGFVVDATTANLKEAYARIEDDLRARYALEYEVFAPVTANQWRSIKVSVAEPRWTTRAIQGYFSR